MFFTFRIRCRGSGCFQPVNVYSDQGLRRLLHLGRAAEPAVVVPVHHQPLGVRSPLHLRKHHGPGLDLLPDGTRQPAEEDVRPDPADSHRPHAGVPGSHPHVRPLVGQEGAGHHLLRHAVLCHDVVFHLLHPLRQRRYQKVLRISRQLKVCASLKQ